MNPDANHVIDWIGGTVAVAEAFGITHAAVSQWRRRGIPRQREQQLRQWWPGAFRKERRRAA